MNSYEGVCQGGPIDGKALAHWSQLKEYLEPVIFGDGPDYPNLRDDQRLEGREVGTYVYSSAGGGCWIWEPAHDPLEDHDE